MLGSAISYDDRTVQALIHALKFRGIAGAAEPLAGMLVDYIERVGLDLKYFIAIPMPLSERRARARGFNQSALIARQFARALGIPFETDLLMRIRHRKPQSDTETIFERRENVKGCFALANGADVRGKKLVLVDDVTTSGTTFGEAARILKSAGAKKIFALAVAKA
jgi:ComF family protein